jgi:adenylate kinase
MIVVMGLPGAGKTTVLKEAVKDTSFKIVNYGDAMFEVALKEGLVSDRDQMRKLPFERQKEIQKKAAEKLSKEKGDVLLDTHCSIKTKYGYLPGLPHNILKELNPKALVLIVAPAKDITRRRNEDLTRKRDKLSEEEILEDVLVNKIYLFSYSALIGAPTIIIENKDGKLGEAVGKLKEFLKEKD